MNDAPCFQGSFKQSLAVCTLGWVPPNGVAFSASQGRGLGTDPAFLDSVSIWMGLGECLGARSEPHQHPSLG